MTEGNPGGETEEARPSVRRGPGVQDEGATSGKWPDRPDFALEPREKKLAVYVENRLERRLTAIIRQETGDSYAGLPADHVLINLDRAFPDVGFAERMMARLELEQRARIERERAQDDLAKYEAETRRIDAQEERKLVGRTAWRAVGVLVLLLGVGGWLTATGHETAGSILLGTTMVAVVGAFLAQQIRGMK